MECTSCESECDPDCVFVPNVRKRWEGGALSAHFLRLLSGTKPRYTELIRPVCRKCAKKFYRAYLIERLLLFIILILVAIISFSGSSIKVSNMIFYGLFCLWFIILSLNDLIVYKYGQKLRKNQDIDATTLKEKKTPVRESENG